MTCKRIQSSPASRRLDTTTKDYHSCVHQSISFKTCCHRVCLITRVPEHGILVTSANVKIIVADADSTCKVRTLLVDWDQHFTILIIQSLAETLQTTRLRLVGVVLIGNSLPLAPSDQIRTETASLLVCDDDRGTRPGQTRSSPTPSLASTRCARTAPLSPPPRVARGVHRTCPPAVGCAHLLPAVRHAKVLPAVGTVLLSRVLRSLSLAFHGHFGTCFIKLLSLE